MIVSLNVTRPLAFLLPLLLVAFCYAIDQQRDSPPIPCHNSEFCITSSNAVRNASCKNGYCVCTNGSVVSNCSSSELMHQSNRNAGSSYRSCKLDQDCIQSLNNSFCNTTVSHCECHKDHVFSTQRNSCLKKADSIDYPCTDDNQCLSFSANTTCKSGQCSCIAGYHYTGNACYKTIDLGKPCARNEECSRVYGAVCNEDNICNCPEATVLNESKERCLLVAREILENCTEHAQCNETFPDALCVDRKCQCQDRYHFEMEEQRCFIDKKLDEVCANSYECYQTEEENENATEKAVKCVQNLCTCAENFVREGDICINEGTRSRESLMLLFLVTILSIAFSTRT